jgi:hypothetical protein
MILYWSADGTVLEYTVPVYLYCTLWPPHEKLWSRQGLEPWTLQVLVGSLTHYATGPDEVEGCEGMVGKREEKDLPVVGVEPGALRVMCTWKEGLDD